MQFRYKNNFSYLLIAIISIFLSLSASILFTRQTSAVGNGCPVPIATGSIHPSGNVNATIQSGSLDPVDVMLVDSITGKKVANSDTKACPPTGASAPVNMSGEFYFYELKATFVNAPYGKYRVCTVVNNKCSADFDRTSSSASPVTTTTVVADSFIPASELNTIINKKVYVTVNINTPNASQDTNYGPLTLTIVSVADPEKVIATAKTESITVTAGTPASFFDLHGEGFDNKRGALFDNIAGGITYRVCVQGTSFCSDDFQKVDISESDIKFSISKANTTTLATVTSASNTSCAIEGVGWILCHTLDFLASATDGSYDILKDYLETKPELVQNGSSTNKAWSAMLTIANIVFVILFLVIIYSQLTSVGITNYGIKKMLPRLIITAILVNLSFFICQISIDISNIIGNSVESIINSIRISMGPSQQQARTFTTITASVISDAALLSGVPIAIASLSTLVPTLALSFVGAAMILVILVARQALIVLLVVIAPLAFVAYLLPNTERWFSTWRKALLSMLLLYPIVALVYSVSSLASDILAGVLK